MPDPTALSFLSKAQRLDAEDPLAAFRDRFEIEEGGPIYLDGNSLGRMPKRAREILNGAADEWAHRLVRGWNESWMEAGGRIAGKIARLIGAKPSEVVLADSTSVNLFKLAIAALNAQAPRRKIVTDEVNFHTDRYVFQGIAELLGAIVEEVPPGMGIEERLGNEVALLSLSHTSFKTSAVHDMAGLSKVAHDSGALVLWDLSHSVGAIPVDLNGCNADLAVGCGYKYLNGGPGAPAFLFVNEELQYKLRQPIWGWLGHANPFAFEQAYRPTQGIQGYASGTPPVLSMLALEPGVDLNLEAGMDRIRAKSEALSEFLIEMWEQLLEPQGIGLASPREICKRGSHIALSHPDGLAIDLALIHEMKVIPDFRAPDIVRFGLSSLYNSFSEVAEAMLKLRTVVQERVYENHKNKNVLVT